MFDLLTLLIAFALISLLSRRLSYGIAVVIASAVFIALSNAQDFIQILIKALTDETTINLLTIVALIGILGYLMQKTGETDGFIRELKPIVKKQKVLLPTIPMLLGLLPIPGGALMSAPLIDGVAKKLNVNSSGASFINVWFRHTILLIFPLEPTLILVAKLTGVNMYSIILLQIPMFVAAVLVGYLLAIRRLPGKEENGNGSAWKLLLNLSPIAVVILLNIAGLHLVLSLAVGIAVSLAIGRVRPRSVPYTLFKGLNFDLILAIGGVMLFKWGIESSSLLGLIENFVRQSHLPPAVLLTVLSFSMTFAMGLLSAALGIAVALFPYLVMGNAVYASLLFMSSFLGYLISPLHLCNVVTLNYFRENLKGLYTKLLPSALIMLIFSFVFLALV
jgi:integral membrane protein (TIGR00529 family)